VAPTPASTASGPRDIAWDDDARRPREYRAVLLASLPDEAFARYVANALKQDELKTGSIETSGDD